MGANASNPAGVGRVVAQSRVTVVQPSTDLYYLQQQPDTVHIVRAAVMAVGDTRSTLTEMLTAVDVAPAILKCSVSVAIFVPYEVRPAALHQALKTVLGQYPTLGGRLCKLSKSDARRGDGGEIAHGILCSNDGVPLTESWLSIGITEAAVGVYNRSGFGYNLASLRAMKAMPPPSSFAQSLNFRALLEGEEPLMKVKLTHLGKDSTCVIGITTAHILTDGSAAVRIARDLAAAYRHAACPSAEPSVPLPPPAACWEAASSLACPHPPRSPTIVTAPVLEARASAMDNPDNGSLCGSYGSIDVPGARAGSTAGSIGRDRGGVVVERNGQREVGCGAGGAWQLRSTEGSGGAGGHTSLAQQGVVKPRWSKDVLRRQHTGKGGAAERIADQQYASLVIPKAVSPTVLGAVCSQLTALKAVRHDLARLGPSAFSDLCTPVLHIPQADLSTLKGLASACCSAPTSFVSSNDAVTALLWLVTCYLRGRPVPGQARLPGLHAHTFYGIALDMRRNGLAGPGPAFTAGSAGVMVGGMAGAAAVLQAAAQAAAGPSALPMAYVGNAACTVQCKSQDNSDSVIEASVRARLPIYGQKKSPRAAAAKVGSANMTLPSGPQAKPATLPEVEQAQADLLAAMQRDGQLAGHMLSVAASKVRGAVGTYRSMPNASGAVMRYVYNYVTSSWAARAILASRYLRQCDGFLTSWQFPIWDIDFGQGPPAHFHPVMMPTAPWSALSLPAHPEAPGGGVYLFTTVPLAVLQQLQSCPLLPKLVPNAIWLPKNETETRMAATAATS